MSEEKLTETRAYWLGYLAGIIDGEGTISLHRMKGRGWRGQWHEGSYWYPIVQIGNDSLSMLEIIKDFCEGGSISASTIEGKVRYTYHMPPNIQRKILPQLSLTIKEEHRILLLDSLERVGRWKKCSINDFMLERSRERFVELNKRGGIP